jgi:hypothetical protein
MTAATAVRPADAVVGNGVSTARRRTARVDVIFAGTAAVNIKGLGGNDMVCTQGEADPGSAVTRGRSRP